VATVTRIVHELDADLLAMARRGRHGFRGALRGSPTQRVLRPPGPPGVVSMRRVRLAGAALALAGALGSSCGGYGVGYVLRSHGGAAKDAETAARVATDVASSHRLWKHVDYREEAPKSLPDESLLLLEFESTPAVGQADDGERSRIVLGVATSRDGSELRVVLQDLDRASESDHFRRIRGDLESGLDAAFAGRTIERQGGRVKAKPPER